MTSKSDLCALTRLCTQPHRHRGPCNTALRVACACSNPDPRVVPGWSSPLGHTYECAHCHRWSPPPHWSHDRLYASESVERTPPATHTPEGP